VASDLLSILFSLAPNVFICWPISMPGGDIFKWPRLSLGFPSAFHLSHHY